MTRRTAVSMAIALYAALVGVGAWKIIPRYYRLNIAGHTVHAPWGWHVFSNNTFVHVRFDDTLPGTVGIIDRRSRPEHADTFVASWKAAAGSKGFHPLSLDEFHDSAVDSAGMRCVAIRTKPPNPLTIFCATIGGHWRLVLAGDNSDITGLDELATQMSMFEDK